MTIQAGSKLSNIGVLRLEGGTIKGDVENDTDIGKGAGASFIVDSGASTINGNFLNNGTGVVTIGPKRAILNITGNFTTTAKANSFIDVYVQQNDAINQIQVTGVACLAGQLKIDAPQGYVPGGAVTYEPLIYGGIRGTFSTPGWFIGGKKFFPRYQNNKLVVAQNQGAQLGTNTTAVASLNPSFFGQAVTLAATVAPAVPAAGKPTGTVDFFNEDGYLGSGMLSEVAGQQVATFSTFSLALGTHSITASYGGDSNFGSSDSSPITQTVNSADYAVTLDSSEGPSLLGDSVTFTATVTANSPYVATPTGTVDFYADGNSFGSAPWLLLMACIKRP